MYLGPDSEHTVYEGECVGQMLGVELVRREEGVEKALFAVDSQAAIQVLDSIIAKPGHYLFNQVHRDVEELKEIHSNLELHVAWVPGHEGVQGNELVDKEAKRAAQGHTDRQLPPFLRNPLPISKSTAKQTFNAKLKGRTKQVFKRCWKYTD
jgi:ribonuclease HI